MAMVTRSALALVALAWSCLHSLQSVHAMRPQTDYPACAINHSPEYYCCEYGSEKEVYTRYNRPNGPDHDAFFAEGWKFARQVNFPDAFYTPNSPIFHYDKPDEVCRVQRIVLSNGQLKETLQCGSATTITDALGGQVVTNASLGEDSTSADVFWTSRTSARNSNASFPIGATCRSLMLPSGKVDEDAKAKCAPSFSTESYRFTTFMEGPLVFVYVVYGLLLVVLMLWAIGRTSLGVLNGAGPSTEQSSTGGALKNSRLGGGGAGGVTKYVDEQSGLVTPMLTRRNTEVELRAAADAIEQTGYRDSIMGKFVLGYYVLLTVGLFPIMVVVILDSNRHFTPILFDPVNVLIIVYMVVWLITTVWLALLVIYYDRLVNFFRIPEPLERCQYVNMFNPEASEILLADRSGVSQFIGKVELLLFPRYRNGYEQTLTVQTTPDGHRYVEFQHMRYTFDELYGKFLPAVVPGPETYAQILEQSQGLSGDEVVRRMATVGRNAIQVPMPSTAASIAQEVCSFFYIYELMCYYVWYFTGYWHVAFLNTAIIVGVIAFNIVSKRRILLAVLEMTRTTGGVAVQRDGVWQTIKVSELVPGDLVRVVENWDIPCDLVIVKGNVLCDESALTGESMPVQKFPVPIQCHDLYDAEDQTGKKHTLFAGAKTLASGARRAEKKDEILAVVTTTGAHTVRGQLIQSILYPSLVRFKYEEHLKACILFLLMYGVVAAYLAMKFLMDNAGLSNTLFAFVYGMFMLSAVLSPLIPVVITVGQANASRRLHKRGIYCLNPQRIALCGKVRVFAFDKTGTITKEGLDFRSVLPVQLPAKPTAPQPARFASRECHDATSSELPWILQCALASCHAVGYLDEELVGNEVEVKMLQATKWRLVEEQVLDAQGNEQIRTIVDSADGGHSLEIVERFEFDHQRVCMSVIVEDVASKRRFAFCKGSYEKMRDVCVTQSVPSEYMARAERLAKQGCYVLGIGFKELPARSLYEGQRASRDDIECDLTLLGLVTFQNELKEDSTDVIAKLKEGNIRVAMITGDNAMTGCYIARECGMVNHGARVVLGEILAVNDQGARALVWKDVDTLEIVSNREVHDMAEGILNGRGDQWELAVTGHAFNYLRKMGELRKLLFHIRIFSRMTPVEKADCIAEMMAAGAVTGMCGDGGNDCGALRIAHVGVALSDTEASVVSPFTSKHKSIESVLDVCREGRCSLATSFGNLKFLMMYGLIGCGLRFTMYSNAVFMSEYAFMFCDGLVLVGMSYAISLAKPLPTLGKHRPTSSLVGGTTLLSMIGQEVIHIIFLYVAIGMLTHEAWYCPFNPQNVDLVKWWLLQDSHMGSTLFLVIAPQYMITALSYGFGARFHQPVWRNYVLVAYFLALAAIIFYLAVGEPSAFSDRFRLASSTNVIGLPNIPLPSSYRWNLALLIAGNMATIVIYEHVFILGPVKSFLRRRFHKDVLRLRL